MILILMGVAGSGKTTIGKMLAERLGWPFADADDFHPAANVAKISQGIALDDADRAPWLEALAQAERQWVKEGDDAVLACSALKQSYREQLRVSPEVKFVFLSGDYDLIYSRLQTRHGHFATTELLASQIATLEPPSAAEGDVVNVNVSGAPEAIAAEIRVRLGLT
jgi:gluconokinase